MELPIRIMITLFVAIVVGATIIVFARQIIMNSQEDIERTTGGIDPSDVEEQKIIELRTLNNQQVEDLIVECYNQHHRVSLGRELCFVVIATETDPLLNYAVIKTNAENMINGNVTVTNVGPTDYAFKMYFDPIGVSESIEISK